MPYIPYSLCGDSEEVMVLRTNAVEYMAGYCWPFYYYVEYRRVGTMLLLDCDISVEYDLPIRRFCKVNRESEKVLLPV
jgi:hypothetical protein